MTDRGPRTVCLLLCRLRQKQREPCKASWGSDMFWFNGWISNETARISKWALAVLVSISCASLVWRCRAAYAVENAPALAPQLLVKVRALWGHLWPKILQVLSVFRDQGLLISVILALSAFFSMAETSIMTLWPWKVQELAEKNRKSILFGSSS